MNDVDTQTFLQLAQSLAHQAKLGHVAASENKRLKQQLEAKAAALNEATIRAAQAEGKCQAQEARCDDLVEQLREARSQMASVG